jgi:hypothetical protein
LARWALIEQGAPAAQAVLAKALQLAQQAALGQRTLVELLARGAAPVAEQAPTAGRQLPAGSPEVLRA